MHGDEMISIEDVLDDVFRWHRQLPLEGGPHVMALGQAEQAFGEPGVDGRRKQNEQSASRAQGFVRVNVKWSACRCAELDAVAVEGAYHRRAIDLASMSEVRTAMGAPSVVYDERGTSAHRDQRAAAAVDWHHVVCQIGLECDLSPSEVHRSPPDALDTDSEPEFRVTRGDGSRCGPQSPSDRSSAAHRRPLTRGAGFACQDGWIGWIRPTICRETQTRSSSLRRLLK